MANSPKGKEANGNTLSSKNVRLVHKSAGRADSQEESINNTGESLKHLDGITY